MERIKRRWWTMATFAIAALVIAATLISGLFQIAVYLLPNYRDDLSVWVTQLAGRPVQIGGISLVWRGGAPQLDLSDITLYDEDDGEEVLSAQRLSLGFSPLRLITGELTPSRVALSGLNLVLRMDEQGHVSLAGFEDSADAAQADAEKWLRQLEHFRKLRLENCALTLELPERPELRFTLKEFEAARTFSGFEADGEFKLPPSYGKTLSFEADVRGDLAQPGSWSGEISGEGAGLMPQPWLRGLVAPGTGAGVDDMGLSFEGRIAAGQLSELSLSLSAENLIVTRAGRAQTAESLHANAGLERSAQGWQLDLSRLQLDGEDQLRGTLHYAPFDGGFEFGADAELLRLGRLAPYLQYLREPSPLLARLAGLSGELSGLVLRLRHEQQADRYSVRAQLDGLGLAADDSGYGFAGLGGALTGDEGGGRLLLGQGPLQLSLPQLVTHEVPFSALNGALAWKRSAEGWRVSMPQFGWQLAGSEGAGRFDLLLPWNPADSPELDLDARFSAADASQLKPWMPQHWGDGLRSWLRRGIVSARVPSAQLRIHGPLHDFPFAQGDSGEWKLGIDVADARLNYAPGWPALDQLQAHLDFHGNGLLIESTSAQIGGIPVDRVSARFADFQDALLTVDGQVSGEMAQYYQFLRASPLAVTLAGLVNNTRAAGPAQVGVHLDVPLTRGGEVAVKGTVALHGVQMYYEGLEEPIDDINGTLAFDRSGVSAEQLQARFADVAFGARIEPREGTRGLIVAEFPYTLNAEGSGLSRFVPELVRRGLGGEAHFRAELPLGVDAAALTLTSNLKGVEVKLPAPLAKPAAEANDIRVDIGGDSGHGLAGEQGAPLRIKVEYQNRLGADIAMRAQDGKTLRVAGLNLRLGAGAPPPPAATDLYLRGQVAELDLAAWSAAFLGDEKGGLLLHDADVSAGRWLYKGHALRETHALFAPAAAPAKGWDLKLDGAGAEGSLSYRDAADKDGGARLSGQLVRLDVESPLEQDAAQGAAAGAAPALDPSAWPVLDLDVGALTLNSVDYGKLKLASSRVSGGQKLETFTLGGGLLESTASGQWLREAGQSSARLKFELSSPDFALALKSLGFAQSLSARKTHFDGDLAWEPAADGIAWEQARGHIELDIENGTLRAVDPGAGRVLGLINFYALPRRLVLDFRDVVSSGLGFDKITGGFDFGGGSALTDNLNIQGPSLRMELRGRVGLAAKDYDQRVTVYPDVSSGVTLGAALLGGPAAAAITFIAQQVLEKPLDQVTHLSYQVTGSWDNPQVKRIDSEPDPAKKKGPRTPN